MADPRFPLLSQTDALPLSLAYQERDDRDLEEQIAPLLSGRAGGLEATAERMQADQAQAPAAGGKKREPVRTDTMSTAETVRDRAMRELEEPGIRKAVDATLRTLMGIGVDELQAILTARPEEVDRLSTTGGVLMRFADPVGNSIEAVARETAQRDGLPPEMVERVSTITGILAGAMFPPGKPPRKGAKKAAEMLGEAARAVAGESRLNVGRVSAPERVKALMTEVNRSLSARLATHRAVQPHEATTAASRAAFASLEDALASSVDELVTDKAKALAFRDYFNAVGRKYDELADRALAGDRAAEASLPDAWALLSTMAERDELAGAGLARGLEARKIMSEASRVTLPASPEAQRLRATIVDERVHAENLRKELLTRQESSGLTKLERDFEKVQRTIADLEPKAREAAESRKATEAMRSSLAEETARAAKLKDQIGKADVLGDKLLSAQERVDDLMNRLADLGGDEASMRTTRSALAEEQKRVAELERRVTEARKLTPKMQRAMERAQAKVDDLTAKLGDVKDEDTAAKNLVEHLENERARAKDLTAQITEVKKSTPNLARLEREITKATQMIDTLEQQLADARGARDLAQGVMLAPLSPKDVASLADLYRGAVEADPLMMARRWKALTREQRSVFAAQAAKAMREDGSRGVLYEVWINALLSGPQTHAVNVMSNTMTALWAPAERFLSATASAAESALTLGRHPRTVFYGESTAMLYGIVEGFKDGIILAGRGFKTGRSGLGPEKVEGADSIRRLMVDGDNPVGAATGFWATSWRLPTRALAAEDGFFKGVNYRMELRALAYREASLKGFTGTDFAEEMRRIIADPPTAIRKMAEQGALIRTFTRELQDLGAVGTLAEGVTKISNAIDQMAHIPAGRLITPFIRTPANLFHQTFERLPGLNLLSDTLRADLRAGGHRRAEALGKIGAGAMVAGVVSTFVASGRITGEGPRDPAQRAMWLKTHQPNSIRIGDTWYAYNRLDPLGNMIGTVANASEIIGQLPESGLKGLPTAIVLALSRSMINKTYMEGLSNLVEWFADPTRNPDPITGFARTLSPTLLRTVERTMDPAIRERRADPDDPWREVNELLNEVKAGVPGWSSSLPPRRNLFGEVVHLPPGWGSDMISPWVSVVSPIATSQVKDDPVAKELVRLKLSLSMPRRTVEGAQVPRTRLTDERVTEGIELTPAEYDLYVRLAGNELKDPATGLGMKDTLASLIQSPDYRAQTDGPDGGKALMIRRVVQGFRKAAEAEVFDRSPGLEDALEEKLAARARALDPTAPPKAKAPGLTDQFRQRLRDLTDSLGR